MEHSRPDLLTIEARLDVSCASIEVQRVELLEEIESDLPAHEDFRIDFSLTPRTPGARMSFRHRWPDHRYEHLGKVYLVPPGEDMKARSGAGSQEAVICFLRPSMLHEWMGSRAECIGRDLNAGLDIKSAEVRRLMARIGAEARTPGFASIAMCEAISMQIAVELGRYYLAWEGAATGAALSPWRLTLIDDSLRASRSPPTLAALAELCGISVRHLTRGFRAARGCSIGIYIRDRQIDIAKHALLDGEGVKAIAHRLGFGSRSSFAHAFQKATGLAPQQFRHRHTTEQRLRLN